MEKKAARMRRSRRTRYKSQELGVHRLCVHKTPRHIYAQIIAPGGGAVLAAVSTLDKQLREELPYGGNVAAATRVGQLIAERSQAIGVKRVAFDRAGFKYHGRIAALADAAREHGLEF